MRVPVVGTTDFGRDGERVVEEGNTGVWVDSGVGEVRDRRIER